MKPQAAVGGRAARLTVGFDGLVLRARNAGSLRYFALLVAALADAPLHGRVFAAPEVLAELALGASFTAAPVAPRRGLPAALQQQTFGGWTRRGSLDLLHAPVFPPPLRYPGRRVMSVLDLTYRREPRAQKWTGRLWWRLLGAAGMRAADHLIAISESTRADVLRAIPDLAPTKISVIYPYAAAHFSPVAPQAGRAAAQRYGLPERFFLFVGTLERRKNLVTLLEAFAQARRGPAAQHALVLVGGRGWLNADVFAAIERLDLGRAVILPGYVPEADLPALYRAAEVCVLLSSYEGFGYPLLEAMACGTPTLAARAGSLPEVVGEAGVLVDPRDVEAVAAALAELARDPQRRAELSARGLVQAQRFSAERFRRETLAVYRQVAEGEHAPGD